MRAAATAHDMWAYDPDGPGAESMATYWRNFCQAITLLASRASQRQQHLWVKQCLAEGKDPEA